MEDTEIIALYLERSEAAIRETDRKYKALLYWLSYRILRDGCDAEEVVDDTYLGAWNAIPPTVPDSLKHFLSRIARNLSLDRLDYRLAGKRRAQFVELDECIPDPRRSVEKVWEAKELGELLNRFLGTLARRVSSACPAIRAARNGRRWQNGRLTLVHGRGAWRTFRERRIVWTQAIPVTAATRSIPGSWRIRWRRLRRSTA